MKWNERTRNKSIVCKYTLDNLSASTWISLIKLSNITTAIYSLDSSKMKIMFQRKIGIGEKVDPALDRVLIRQHQSCRRMNSEVQRYLGLLFVWAIPVFMGLWETIGVLGIQSETTKYPTGYTNTLASGLKYLTPVYHEIISLYLNHTKRCSK